MIPYGAVRHLFRLVGASQCRDCVSATDKEQSLERRNSRFAIRNTCDAGSEEVQAPILFSVRACSCSRLASGMYVLLHKIQFHFHAKALTG